MYTYTYVPEITSTKKKKFLSDFKTKVSNAENNWEGKQINHSLSKT